jgi:hypothetical protein
LLYISKNFFNNYLSSTNFYNFLIERGIKFRVKKVKGIIIWNEEIKTV